MYEENPLIIQAENLENFKELFSRKEFQCVVTTSEGIELFRMEAVLSREPFGSEVECQQQQVHTFSYHSETNVKSLHSLSPVQL